MRFSRTNMRLAAARCRSLSREIRVQTAEFSITDFCRRNLGPIKSGTYAPKIAKIGPALFNLSNGSLAPWCLIAGATAQGLVSRRRDRHRPRAPARGARSLGGTQDGQEGGGGPEYFEYSKLRG